MNLMGGGIAQYQDFPLNSMKTQFYALLYGCYCKGTYAQTV